MNMEVGNYMAWLIWMLVPAGVLGVFAMSVVKWIAERLEKPAAAGDRTAIDSFEWVQA